MDVPLRPPRGSGVAADRRRQLSLTTPLPLRGGDASNKVTVAQVLLQRAAVCIDELNVLAGGAGVLEKAELRRRLDDPTWLGAIALDELEAVDAMVP